MIPRIIHYCWFGGKDIPKNTQKYIESWKKHCPNYRIVLWNEDNFPIDDYAFSREAADTGDWAFVSDVARLYALYNFGGVYVDTDVEIIKNFDDMLSCTGVIGFEEKKRLSTAFICAEDHNPIIEELLDSYQCRHYSINNLTCHIPNVFLVTDVFHKYGLKKNNKKQVVEGFNIYPSDYFSPKNHYSKQIVLTDNTVAIHHFEGSWENEEDKQKHLILDNMTSKGVPILTARIISKIISVYKARGLVGIGMEIKSRFMRR